MTDEPQEGARQPTEEELRAALEEQMKKITVKDVLLQTVITLINVSARKLGLAGDEGEKDLAEAQRGIDGVRALVPLLPSEEQTAVREPLSQLQMAYAREAGASAQRAAGSAQEQAPRPETRDPTPETRDPTPETRDPTPETRDPRPDTRDPTPSDDERAKARSKIWTPPGT